MISSVTGTGWAWDVEEMGIAMGKGLLPVLGGSSPVHCRGNSPIPAYRGGEEVLEPFGTPSRASGMVIQSVSSPSRASEMAILSKSFPSRASEMVIQSVSWPSRASEMAILSETFPSRTFEMAIQSVRAASRPSEMRIQSDFAVSRPPGVFCHPPAPASLGRKPQTQRSIHPKG
jgi:hypothetical protein